MVYYNKMNGIAILKNILPDDICNYVIADYLCFNAKRDFDVVVCAITNVGDTGVCLHHIEFKNANQEIANDVEFIKLMRKVIRREQGYLHIGKLFMDTSRLIRYDYGDGYVWAIRTSHVRCDLRNSIDMKCGIE